MNLGGWGAVPIQSVKGRKEKELGKERQLGKEFWGHWDLWEVARRNGAGDPF